MSKTNSKISELKSTAETITATINDPDTPENEKEELRAAVEEIQRQIQLLKKARSEKPPKEKAIKPEIRFGEKSIRDVSSSELDEAFKKRLERVNEVEGKVKTKSIFTRNGQASEPKIEAAASAE